jgi:monoamine oxidase
MAPRQTERQRRVHGVISAATEAIFGCEPRELSLLYTLFYIAASGNEQNRGTFERNFNTAAARRSDASSGGRQTIALRVASQLEAGCPEHARDPHRPDVVGHHRSTPTAQVRADRVDRRRPAGIAAADRLRSALPGTRDQLTHAMPQGTLMKFEASTDAVLARRAAQRAGRAARSARSRSPSTRPEDGSRGIMMGFIGGHEARVWRALRASAARPRSQNLADFFGSQALNPARGRRVQLVGRDLEPRLPGRGPRSGNARSTSAPRSRAPVGRIHWAGTETSTYWNGYMDGPCAPESAPPRRSSPSYVCSDFRPLILFRIDPSLVRGSTRRTTCIAVSPDVRSAL